MQRAKLGYTTALLSVFEVSSAGTGSEGAGPVSSPPGRTSGQLLLQRLKQVTIIRGTTNETDIQTDNWVLHFAERDRQTLR